MEELSIYVHIPFCVQKCAYCDFLSEPVTVKKQKEYSKALLTEIKLVGETGPAFCWNEQLDIDWIEKKEHTIVKSIFLEEEHLPLWIRMIFVYPQGLRSNWNILLVIQTSMF